MSLCVDEYGVNAGFFTDTLAVKQLDLPLGWSLSRAQVTAIATGCVYRKLKLGRSGGEVRQGWRVI
jgi:hypothetical protein